MIPDLPSRRLAAYAVLAGLLFAGCGGSGGSTGPDARGSRSPAASNSTAGTPPSGASSTPGGRGTPGGSGTPSAGSSSVASSGATGRPGGSTAPSGGASRSPQPVPFVATLAAKCVVPGGTQTVHISTAPYALLVYDTRYADNKTGAVYGGIEANGRADGAGQYSKSFVVAPVAPAGEATVYAGGNAEGYAAAGANLTFQVARTC